MRIPRIILLRDLVRLFGWAKPTPPLVKVEKEIRTPYRFYIRHRKTKMYLGECHTTGDGFWTPDIKNASSFPSRESAAHGFNYHPFFRLRDDVAEIVEDET